MTDKLAYSFFEAIDPIACVVVVHGMAEHRRRYEEFAVYLKENRISVLTYDLPGHGESSELDGYFGKDGLNALINSIDYMVEKAKSAKNNLPIILLGHSMGAILARCYIQNNDRKIAGVILSGAPNYQSLTGVGVTLGKALRLIKGEKGYSKLMDQLVTGNFNKAIENPRTELDWLSYNTENVDAYIADRKCGFPFTIQGYIDELSGMLQMHNSKAYRCANPELSIYFVQGQDDPCVGGEKGLEDSVSTLVDAGYHMIRTKKFIRMRHEIFKETEKEAVFKDVKDWIHELITSHK